MTEHGTETATGTEQEPKITTEQAAADKPATETATDAGEQQTEEQKAAADEARKAEEVRKSKEGTPDPVQKKIDKEVGRRKAAEAEAARAREEAAYLRGKLESGKPETSARAEEFQPTRPAPEETDFESHAEFVRATVAWDREQAETKAAQVNARKSWEEKIADHMEKGIKAFEDFEVVTNDRDAVKNITNTMYKFCIGNDVGHVIAHELLTNKAEAAKIAQLDEIGQVRALTRMEDRIRAATAAPAPPAQKKPAPPAPPATLGKGGTPPPDESKLSDEQWYEEEKKRIAEQKKGGRR